VAQKTLNLKKDENKAEADMKSEADTPAKRSSTRKPGKSSTPAATKSKGEENPEAASIKTAVEKEKAKHKAKQQELQQRLTELETQNEELSVEVEGLKKHVNKLETKNSKLQTKVSNQANELKKRKAAEDPPSPPPPCKLCPTLQGQLHEATQAAAHRMASSAPADTTAWVTTAQLLQAEAVVLREKTANAVEKSHRLELELARMSVQVELARMSGRNEIFMGFANAPSGPMRFPTGSG